MNQENKINSELKIYEQIKAVLDLNKQQNDIRGLQYLLPVATHLGALIYNIDAKELMFDYVRQCNQYLAEQGFNPVETELLPDQYRLEDRLE